MLNSEGYVDEQFRLNPAFCEEAFWDPTSAHSRMHMHQEESLRKRNPRVTKGEILITSHGVFFDNLPSPKFTNEQRHVLICLVKHKLKHDQELVQCETIARQVGITKKEVRKNITLIRDVLKDDRIRSRWIATVSGGYRLVATVVQE